MDIELAGFLKRREAIFSRLRDLNLEEVEVYYYGSGSDGCISDMLATAGEISGTRKFNRHPNESDESIPKLKDDISHYCLEVLVQKYPKWNADLGSDGCFTFEIKSNIITWNHSIITSQNLVFKI